MPQPWETAGKQPWEAAAGTQVKQAPPAYQYEGPTAAAGLTGKTIENTKGAATLPYDITTAKNQATSSGIKAQSDQIDLNIKKGTPPGDPAKSGPAYLNSLPQGVRDLTTAMLANRYPATINRNIPVVNQAVLAANHIDPKFDSTRYNMRVSLMNHTLAGSDADELKALNTAITHAGMAYDQVAKIPSGADYGWSPLTHTMNALTNYNHSADPSLKNLHNMLQAYSQEKSKVYQVNTGGGQADEASNYDLNDPGKTIQSNIRTDLHLLMGRAGATLNKYNVGNGGQAPLEALSPDAQAVLRRLAPDLLTKYYSQRPDPLAQAMGITLPGAPPGPGTPTPSGGITPPPTGSGGAIAPSSNGVSDLPDPKSEAFWEGAARKGTPYVAALREWQQSLPSGASITPPDPKAYADVAAYMAKNPNVDYHPVQSILRHPLSTGAAVMNDVAQNPGGAFAGHYFNNLSMGTINKLAGDKGALFNTVSEQQNPKASFGGDVLGMAGAASLAGKGVGAATDALSGLMPMAAYFRSMGLLAPEGAGADAITAAKARQALTGDQISSGVTGANNNPDHPTLGAMANMAAMGTGNLVGKYTLGPALGALGGTGVGEAAVNLGRKGMNFARTLGGLAGDGSAVAPFSAPAKPAFPMSTATQSAIPEITGKLQQAQDAGLPYMIADADPRLRAMLGSAGRFSPDVQAKAENILQPRQAGQGERAIGQINKNLAPVGDVPTMQAQILKAAQGKSGPLYDAAKAQPVPNLAANPTLADVLDRPAAQAAVRAGYNKALNNGEDVGTLSYGTDANGNTVATGNPSWNVLHYTRQELDNAGETGTRRALDDQIATLNPGFKAADAAYSGAMKGSDALQAGVSATGIKVTPEATQRAMAGFPNNSPQFQQGYASNMADQIEQQRFSGNPYNLVNGSMGQQSKLGMVFPNGAQGFNTAHALEGDMGKTYQGVLGNSMTQNKAMADKAFSLGDMADFGVDAGVAAATGNPASLGMLFLRKGIDSAKYGMNRQKADAIAPFLMNPDPGANLATLSQWARQNAARKAYLNQAGNVGSQMGVGLLGAPAISWASQN